MVVHVPRLVTTEGCVVKFAGSAAKSLGKTPLQYFKCPLSESRPLVQDATSLGLARSILMIRASVCGLSARAQK